MRVRNRNTACKLLLAAGLCHPSGAQAHASNQSFVLLLPTEVYITAGAASVLVTVLLLAFLPGAMTRRLYRTQALPRWRLGRLRLATSLTSTAVLMWLIAIGLTGPRDPLTNLMPLSIWVVWWIVLVSLQGLVGDLWRWLNPWSGAACLMHLAFRTAPPFRLPRRLGHLGAILSLSGFAAFLLADPAPADPARLARVVGVYWLFTMIGIALFGTAWLTRVEGLTALMRAYARVAPLRRGRVGLWGWQALTGPGGGRSLAVFTLLILGIGSFDGLNETFWWLARIGINPLEFPGRSAVVLPMLAGLFGLSLALIGGYVLSLWAGLALAGLSTKPVALAQAACRFAPSFMPIALGYHIAHYLPGFLVDSQYVVAALSDPLARGDDLLGLGTFYVTTGFFNTQGSVRLIWLTQAGAVVTGHILALLLAHVLALRADTSSRRASLVQAPLALVMVGYTVFGLWLLASPRG